ncbi:uncharacterized protein MELLADRAFT_103265 [Melampsora larici-populina 98AG31]|uniref:Uncharacterized protein n=1 Tax=Melampsora larici-populina (strain 98AG31 / pathotype 3-4-7) TaxID=747676 RepID=F4R9U3_MELLP|nr:uncharacterized protein MELLADRAFT_103265 [Melampsora larici-populina 98AG31]EGG10583.1 hypothetical protein MELLADRAFT_103265 [Melampsora larici-populina 98AG31]
MSLVPNSIPTNVSDNARLPINWSGVFKLNTECLRLSSGGGIRECFQSTVVLLVGRRPHLRFFVSTNPNVPTLEANQSYRLVGEMLGRSNRHDTVLSPLAGGVIRLEEYEAQLPQPLPVITVASRGHIMRCVRRRVVGQDYERWVITAMHNGWDDSLGSVAHFLVLYEASLKLFNSIGVNNLSTGNIVNFSGVVINYSPVGRAWVVELRAVDHIVTARPDVSAWKRRASAST